MGFLLAMPGGNARTTRLGYDMPVGRQQPHFLRALRRHRDGIRAWQHNEPWRLLAERVSWFPESMQDG